MTVREAKYSGSFFFSLCLHMVVIIALIASFNFNSAMPVLENSDQHTEIINARVMMSHAMPVKTLPKPQPQKIIQQKIIQQKITQEKVVQTLPEKETIAISDKKIKKQQQKKIADQMLADIQKEKIKQKKLKQKSLAADFEKDMKQMAAQSLQQDMLQEQKKMAGARQQKMRGVVDKYKALILQTISQNWRIPPTVNKNLSAELMIRVAPGGVVLDVMVIKSSGDESLDHSARLAVLKSSPLPVPADADAFEPFRQFVLKVKPKDILNTENWES